jgi:hypothetical protein
MELGEDGKEFTVVPITVPQHEDVPAEPSPAPAKEPVPA